MRNALFAILAVTFALACKKAARIPARAQEATARVPASLSGKLLETIDAAQYTYLRLQTKGDEVWAAVTTTKQAVGTEVTIVGPIWMENFKSNSLNRTWPRIAFGTLDGEAATQPAAVRLPSGHPATASADWGWRAFTSGAMTVAACDGTHYTVLSRDAVPALAEDVERWMRLREQRTATPACS